MNAVYDYPAYYDLAFSFRDVPGEADAMAEAIEAYSRRPVAHVLEIGCGSATHAPCLCARGYDYIGLDINPRMLEAARKRTYPPGSVVNFVQADMRDFTLDHPADFAYVLLGSWYMRSTDELLRHMERMAKAIKPGGLYFLDWCVLFEGAVDVVDSWEIDGPSAHVDVTVHNVWLDKVEQVYEERIRLDVQDRGEALTLEQQGQKRALFPQEFLLFAENSPHFEFVGWWNDWDLTAPLTGREESIHRPITLLRRV